MLLVKNISEESTQHLAYEALTLPPPSFLPLN